MPPARTPTVVATGAPADATPRARVVAFRAAIRSVVDQEAQVLTKGRKKDAYLEALRGWMDAMDEATATVKEALPPPRNMGNLRPDRRQAREAVHAKVQELLPRSGVQVSTEEAPAAAREVPGQRPLESERTAYDRAQRRRAQLLKREDPEAYERALRMQTAHGIVLDVGPELRKAIDNTPPTPTVEGIWDFLHTLEDWLERLQVAEQTADLEDAAVDEVKSWPAPDSLHRFCKAQYKAHAVHDLATWLRAAKTHQQDVRALIARPTQSGRCEQELAASQALVVDARLRAAREQSPFHRQSADVCCGCTARMSCGAPTCVNLSEGCLHASCVPPDRRAAPRPVHSPPQPSPSFGHVWVHAPSVLLPLRNAPSCRAPPNVPRAYHAPRVLQAPARARCGGHQRGELPPERRRAARVRAQASAPESRGQGGVPPRVAWLSGGAPARVRRLRDARPSRRPVHQRPGGRGAHGPRGG